MRDGFHIRHRRVGKIRVIPDVEKVGREPQRVLFGKLETLDEREIPVLLARAAIGIAAQVAKAGYDAISALRGSQDRNGGEIGHVQIAVIHFVLNPASRVALPNGSSRRKFSRQRGCEARPDVSGPRRGINDRERRSGLKNGMPLTAQLASSPCCHPVAVDKNGRS